MKNEDIVKIHLPNGKVYEVELQDGKTTMTEAEISKFRSFLGSVDFMSINVRPDGSNGLMKGMTLILWGDVLKNSYITISRH